VCNSVNVFLQGWLFTGGIDGGSPAGVKIIKEGDPKAKGKAQAAAYCEHGGCFSLLTEKQN
jgi:hypothetical protein